MRLSPFIFGFLLLVASLNSVAVQRDLYFNNLLLEQGLNQGSIYSLAKDSFGFTWIGTQDGLHRFDGHVIELVPLSATLLPKYRFIRDIKVINNQLYVATTDGLVVINLLTGKKRYPDVNNSVIYSVIEVNEQVWLGSETGLIILNFDHEIIDYYGQNNLINNSFCQISAAPKRCSNEIRTLVFDQIKQTVWLGTNTGLFEFNLEGKLSNASKQLDDYLQYHQVDARYLAGNSIRKLFLDSYHKLWIASYYGVHYLNLDNSNYQGRIKHSYHQKNLPNTLASNRVLAIAQDDNGDVLVGTSKGLSRHKNSPDDTDINFTNEWQNFNSHNTSAHSLADNWIRSLLTDSEGRIWVGTNKGLSVTNVQREKVAIYRAAKNNVFNNYILSFTEESDNKYWIGTQEGLYIFDNKRAYSFPELQSDTVYDTLITSNYLWAATRSGLYKINIKNHEVTQHYSSENSPFGEAFIYKLLRIGDSIWLGTTAGLHQLNLESNQWKSWYKKDGLGDSEIYTLYSHHNKLWIGTAKGLSVLDLHLNSFKNYSQQNSSLESHWIFNIHHLEGDRFLVASDGGVYEFNTTDESFDYIGITQGNAYGLTQDEQGYFWVTSNNGLYRYNASTREYKKFVESNGFASNEYNLNASLKNNQGELLLGTVNGFVIFKPENFSQNKYALKPRLVSSMFIDNKRYSLWDKVPLTNDDAIFLAKDFSIGWHDTKITLQLNNPYFAIATPIQSTNFLTNINLSNIQSGSNSIPLSLKNNNFINVTKQAHPLLSWWAVVGYVALFSVMLIFLVRIRLMHKFNKALLTNHEVIANQKNEIENHMQFKQNLYLQIQHSFKSPVFACRGLSKQIDTLLTSENDIDKASIERKNSKLYKALNDISNLIDDFIVLTQKEPVVKVKSKQYILATLVKINALMIDLAITKNVTLNFIEDASLKELDHIFACEKCLYLILENVLSNAIKFSQQNGRVKILSSKISGHLVIEISDNGCGFSSKDLSNIFTLYYRGENSEQYSGTGVGLTTTKQLVDELNGEICFEKNSPCGTIVRIEIPLAEQNGL